MKKVFFIVLVMFVVGVSAVKAQTNQLLQQGQIFNGNMTPGAVHTFR